MLFGLIPFLTILILGRFYLGLKVLECHIDQNDIETKNILKYPYPTCIKKCEISL